MKLFRAWQMRLVLAVMGVAVVVGGVAFSPWAIVLGSSEHVHLTTDWSHRHMIFSAPKTLKQAFNLAWNPRYVQQYVRRNAEKVTFSPSRLHRNDAVARDWSNFIGAGGNAGAGMYPAKYSFDVTTTSCTNDFIVSGNNLAGAAGEVPAINQMTVANNATAATIVITNPNIPATLTLTAAGANAHTGAGTGTWGPASAVGATEAANIAAAINTAGNGSFVGVTAAVGVDVGVDDNIITLTATTPGAIGNSITLSGDVENGTGITLAVSFSFTNGSEDTVSLAAFNEIYEGCLTGGPLAFPQPLFAYNTGGTIHTSVVLSLDGTQVAFVQSIGGVANLTLLKYFAGNTTVNGGLDVTTLAHGLVPAAAYHACVPNVTNGPGTPCMTNIPFGNGADDSNSSPYYDYGSDTIYVGDNADTIHKFTGVFNGALPAEVVGAPWPVNLGNGLDATGPVLDNTSGLVIVADGGNGTTSFGGYLYSISATGVVSQSEYMANGTGVTDTPIVDSTNEKVYVAYSSDGQVPGQSSVNQFAVAAINGTDGTPINIGADNEGIPVFSGDFDNAYYSGGAGHFYVCGNAGATGTPTLYQITASATGVLSTVTTGPALTSAASVCSPVTEFYNPNLTGGAQDNIFLSVQGFGQTTAPISCPTAVIAGAPAAPTAAQIGCIMSFNVVSGAAITPALAPAATFFAPGGTSGIIVDNDVAPGTGASPASLARTSQIYYTPLGNGPCGEIEELGGGQVGIGGCMVQASQSGLQ